MRGSSWHGLIQGVDSVGVTSESWLETDFLGREGLAGSRVSFLYFVVQIVLILGDAIAFLVEHFLDFVEIDGLD